MLAAAVVAAESVPTTLGAIVAVGLGTLGLLAAVTVLRGSRPTLLLVLFDVLVLTAFVVGRDPNAKLWSVPGTWLDVTCISRRSAPPRWCCSTSPLRRGPACDLHRHLAPREQLAVLLVPVLFNLALSLGADPLTQQARPAGRLGARSPDWILGAIGRALVLIVVFVEVLAGCLRILVAGRLTADPRLHAVLIGSAVHAAFAPAIADLPQTGRARGWAVLAVSGCGALRRSGAVRPLGDRLSWSSG